MGGSGGPGAGFDDFDALGAERARGWVPGLNLESGQGGSGDSNFGLAAAAVDDRSGGEDARAVGFEESDDFGRAAAGGDDVFDDDGTVTWRDGEAAAERHAAIGVALGEDMADAEGAGGFVSDNESAHCGGDDDGGQLGRDGGYRGGQGAAEGFGMDGVCQDEGALKVSGAMETAGEAEMALEVGAGGLEQIENFLICDRHFDG